MLKRLGLYITLFISITGQAQYLSVRGDFSIDQQRGCHDLLVSVTNINPGTDVILYQYEGRTSTVTANTTNLYTVAGDYWLFQYIQGPTGQKVDSMLVEIVDPATPDFELQTCNNNSVQVVLNNADYDIYEIDYGDGTVIQVPVNNVVPIHTYAISSLVSVMVTGLFTTANTRCGSLTRNFSPQIQVQPGSFNILRILDEQSVIIEYALALNTVSTLEIALNDTSSYQLIKNLDQGTTLDTITGLQLNSTTYCFRITSHDACSNAKVFSNELCTVKADIQAINNALDLSWQTVEFPGQISLDINRDSLFLTSLASQALTFSDTTVVCDSSYCYYLEAKGSNGSISRSNLICDQAFSTDTPPNVVNISSQINNEQITWSWQAPQGEQALFYEIFDKKGNRLIETNQSSSTLVLEEELDNCVRIKLTNICSNSSELSSEACPLQLTSSIGSDGSVILNWSAYNGWAQGVRNYSAIILDANMKILDSLDVGIATEYIDPIPSDNNQVSYYRVWGIPAENGIALSNSNLIRVERPVVISAPTSFTPNGDNLNDVFVVTGKFIESIELSIINRWGSTIYKVNGSSWDGTVGGNKVALGNYVYHVIVKDFIGNEHIRTGSVLILKN